MAYIFGGSKARARRIRKEKWEKIGIIVAYLSTPLIVYLFILFINIIAVAFPSYWHLQ